jgi:hypothetical protein
VYDSGWLTVADSWIVPPLTEASNDTLHAGASSSARKRAVVADRVPALASESVPGLGLALGLGIGVGLVIASADPEAFVGATPAGVVGYATPGVPEPTDAAPDANDVVHVVLVESATTCPTTHRLRP